MATTELGEVAATVAREAVATVAVATVEGGAVTAETEAAVGTATVAVTGVAIPAVTSTETVVTGTVEQGAEPAAPAVAAGLSVRPRPRRSVIPRSATRRAGSAQAVWGANAPE
jgi:hypothetical protein